MLATEVESRLWRIEDDYLREAVARGCKALRKKYGKTWPDKIDLDALHMEQPSCCIVGQVEDVWDFREWQNALITLGVPFSNASLFGFDVPASMDEEDEDINRITYADLDDAWRLVLSEND